MDDVDTISVTGISRLYGVSRQAVQGWASRRADTGFPEPIDRRGGRVGDVYTLDSVTRWWPTYRHRVARRGTCPHCGS